MANAHCPAASETEAPLSPPFQLVDTQSVVVVTLDYRVNAFGFLGSEHLRDRDGSTGNVSGRHHAHRLLCNPSDDPRGPNIAAGCAVTRSALAVWNAGSATSDAVDTKEHVSFGLSV